jgi:hypothetical protein
MSSSFSFTPGFSPVLLAEKWGNCFKDFFTSNKPLKRLAFRAAFPTRLKPGVNITSQVAIHFGRNQL